MPTSSFCVFASAKAQSLNVRPYKKDKYIMKYTGHIFVVSLTSLVTLINFTVTANEQHELAVESNQQPSGITAEMYEADLAAARLNPATTTAIIMDLLSQAERLSTELAKAEVLLREEQVQNLTAQLDEKWSDAKTTTHRLNRLYTLLYDRLSEIEIWENPEENLDQLKIHIDRQALLYNMLSKRLSVE